MAFLDSTPFVKESHQVEYSGSGDLRSKRDRITVLVQYACDAAGHAGESIPASRVTTVETPGTTCELQRAEPEVGYGDLAGLCTIIYESVTDWELIGESSS